MTTPLEPSQRLKDIMKCEMDGCIVLIVFWSDPRCEPIMEELRGKKIVPNRPLKDGDDDTFYMDVEGDSLLRLINVDGCFGFRDDFSPKYFPGSNLSRNLNLVHIYPSWQKKVYLTLEFLGIR